MVQLLADPTLSQGRRFPRRGHSLTDTPPLPRVPRRSHSATDKEPEPHSACPSDSKAKAGGLGLLDLPLELHYHIFDLLPPLDGACLGLTNSRLYAVHARVNGRVPLSTRYQGPNDREWAWRRNRRAYCRKCGVERCELHRHLRQWFGQGWEYCAIRGVYGVEARGGKPYCYMSSPKNPRRCGRHGGV